MIERELSERARSLHRILCNRFPGLHFELQAIVTSLDDGEWTPSYYAVRVTGGQHRHRSFVGYRPERAYQTTLLELTAHGGDAERTRYDQEVVTTLMSALLREAGWQCRDAWREDGTPQNRYTVRLRHPTFQDVEAEEYDWELMNVLEDAEYYAQYRMVSGVDA